MSYYFKLFLILLIIFIISVLIQSMDDKKYNIKRSCFYEKYKNPILFVSSIGLLLSCNSFNFDLNGDFFLKKKIKFNENLEIPCNNPNEIFKKNYMFEPQHIFDKDEFISFPPPFP